MENNKNLLLQDSLKEVLELGLSGIPIVSMMACGDRTNEKIVIPDQEMTDDERISYFENLCLRWYQLAAYMPALHSEYGHGKYNKIVTKNTNHKWIKRSLDRRSMVSVHKRIVKILRSLIQNNGYQCFHSFNAFQI